MKQQDTLHIGLCLAGAVSAGAYTAGVMDFLIEALEEWDKQRENIGTPTHKVVIPAIGGASAGGMTGLITSAIVNNPLKPVRKANEDLLAEIPENKFYHSWVDQIDKDMFSHLLKTDDINGKLFSLLNSNFIDDIARRALQVDQSNRIERSFFEKELKVFTTLTNLKGFPYHIEMAGGHQENRYYFTRHSDYAAFRLNAQEYKGKGWTPLNYFEDVNVDLACQAGMATGAFPVGLRARKVNRESLHIKDLIWNNALTPQWSIPEGKNEALCVDGGVINNEPFYRVKEIVEAIVESRSKGEEISLDDLSIEERQDDPERSNPDTFRSTTIMIDPFPSTEPEPFKADDGILSVAAKTLSAMLSQVRLKPESQSELANPNNPQLFLIAPTRYEKTTSGEKTIPGSKALACGFLQGFGGFIHKEFRVHDYFLGRANCEQFLREYFTVPVDTTNPIFANGYKNVADKSRFLNKDGDRMQIIPLFKTKTDDPYMPVFQSGSNWPKREEKEIDRYNGAIKQRIGKIIMNIGDLNWFNQFLIWIGNRVILRRKLTKATMKVIKKEMKEWELL